MDLPKAARTEGNHAGRGSAVGRSGERGAGRSGGGSTIGDAARGGRGKRGARRTGTRRAGETRRAADAGDHCTGETCPWESNAAYELDEDDACGTEADITSRNIPSFID